MATFIATLQGSTPSFLCRREKVGFIAGDFSGFTGLRINCHGRGFIATITLPHYVCSTSSRYRDSSIRHNSRPFNRYRNGGSSSSKPVSLLPDDMKLLRDLREFISSADLSPYQVPSTRELAKHGRQDLANAVRRRGEKVVSQLLSNPNFSSTSSGTAKQFKPNSVAAAATGSEVCESLNGVTKSKVDPNSRIYAIDLTNEPQTTDLVLQERLPLFIPQHKAVAEKRSSNFIDDNDRATVGNATQITSAGPSSMTHNEKKSRQCSPMTLDMGRLSEVAAKYEEGDRDDEGASELYTYEDSIDYEGGKHARIKPTESLRKSRASEAWQKPLLKSKSTLSFTNPARESTAHPRRNLEAVFDIMAKQRESDMFLQYTKHEKDLLSAGRTDSEAEVSRLLALLHAKEMENLKLLRELEETKAMLALVRAKHSAEMAQAKLVAVEKDLRLQVAEQALHSLKLTQVDWWGEGSRVEVAGSFNGWEHHIHLLPDLSSKSSSVRPGTPSPLLWRIELWLYPGVYEIKFIVDGKWVLDSRREIVQGHMGQNNLLHVEP